MLPRILKFSIWGGGGSGQYEIWTYEKKLKFSIFGGGGGYSGQYEIWTYEKKIKF